MFNKEYLKNILPKRPKISNKGTFGHVLNVAGSGIYSGAAYFSSVSALKVGCGRSTLASVKTVLRAVSALCPDIILMPLDENKNMCISLSALGTLRKKLDEFNSISIGCGISVCDDTLKFFKGFIKEVLADNKNLVIDADGLSLLAKIDLKLNKNVVLTPHPKEMSRLLGVSIEDILKEPECYAKECALKYSCNVVLKIHETIVTDGEEQIYVNNTGNSALSHGGSGDVLCGMITGFMAQGVKPFEASCLAVYLHGISAELGSIELTEYSVLASDLLKYIPQAIKILCYN